MFTSLDIILIFCFVYFFGKGEFANGYVKGAKEDNEYEVEIQRREINANRLITFGFFVAFLASKYFEVGY